MEITITRNGSFKLESDPVQIDRIVFEQGAGSDSHVQIIDASYFPVFEAWESQAWEYSHNGHIRHVLPRWYGFFAAEGMNEGDKIIIAYHMVDKPVLAIPASRRRWGTAADEKLQAAA